MHELKIREKELESFMTGLKLKDVICEKNKLNKLDSIENAQKELE